MEPEPHLVLAAGAQGPRRSVGRGDVATLAVDLAPRGDRLVRGVVLEREGVAGGDRGEPDASVVSPDSGRGQPTDVCVLDHRECERCQGSSPPFRNPMRRFREGGPGAASWRTARTSWMIWTSWSAEHSSSSLNLRASS